MKSPILSTTFSLTLALFSASALSVAATNPPSGASTPDLHEIPIQTVLIPPLGFDDNDHVQAILHGELPDPCTVLGAASAVVDLQARKIRVTQKVWRRTEGACGNGDLTDEPVAFTNAVSLGRLSAGNYEIEYKGIHGSSGTRPFHVERATALTIDSFSYAEVTQAAISDVGWEKRSLTASISGIFRNSCQSVEDVKIVRNQDVIVVLPLLSNSSRCTAEVRAFKKEISIGELPAGTFLLHVRSRNGSSVNHVFRVMPYPPRLAHLLL